MQSTLARSVSAKVMLACLLASIGIVGWRASAEGEDQANQAPQAEFLEHNTGVPAKYADIYARLNRRVTLNFEKASFDEVFDYLQEKLGKKISLEDAEFDHKQVASEINLQTDQPITIKAALRAFMNYSALHDRQIALAEDEVRLLSPEKAQQQHVLFTHDLRHISSYSTKLRDQLIAEVKRETTPDAWGREDGPWITPGTSVFSIDAYHTPEVHGQVTEAWQKKYGQAWYGQIGFMPFGRETKEPSQEELTKKAKSLQAKFAFESLAPRLKYEEGKAANPPALSPEALERLKQRDEQHAASTKSAFAWLNLRRSSLVKLHSSEVENFVAREGFGLSRMPSPSPSYLELPPVPQLALPSAEIDPPQHEPVARIPGSAAEAAVAGANLPTRDHLQGLHVNSESIFLSPERMGLAKSREEVAGFGAHAFSRLPRLADHDHGLNEPQEHWAMRRMELVSLLKHDKPQVYVSDELPRMDKLGKAPTRELGDFEADALDKLAAGEDVVARASVNRIEMLGALRAAKSCLECHSVDHGELLGAFSYTLVRDPLLEDAAREGVLNRR